jgi:hypothetical protein
MVAKVPAKVKVGPYTYEVRTVNELKLPTVENGAQLDGLHVGGPTNYVILIDSQVKDKHRHCEVVLHEVFHACWQVMSLTDDDKEEDVVTALARALTMVLRDNPDLLKYINRSLK